MRATYGNQECISYSRLPVDICICHHLDGGFLDFRLQLVEGVDFPVLVYSVGPDAEGSTPNTIICAVLGLDSLYEWSDQLRGTVGNKGSVLQGVRWQAFGILVTKPAFPGNPTIANLGIPEI